MKNSDNSQVIIIGAHRYALGRRTYVVTETIEWLKANWDILEQNTKFVIMRDTAGELMDGMVGANMDDRSWREFLKWALLQEGEEFERIIREAVAWKKRGFPIE